jgi:predicted negative regulator of RcsB-dependent stress response
MEEDINIINSNTRNEKIKQFLINNKRLIITFLVLIFLFLVSFFGYGEYKDQKKKSVSDLYNSTIIEYSKNNVKKTTTTLIEIIKKKDSTYSPLSLYFIIDNDLITDTNVINNLFDIIVNKISLDKEIRNLIIYKKALFNADYIDENGLINILNPIINSDSVWKSHSLYLIGEFFYSKNEKQKSKEFFSQIVNLENANSNLKKEAQKRLIRDLSD